MKSRIFVGAFLWLLVNTSSRAQTQIEAGYAGATITHPGATFRYGKTLIGSERGSTKRIDVLATARAGVYFHRNRHAGVYFDIGIEWIRTTRKGFQFGVDLPAGYLRAFIPKVYQISGSGEINKLPWAGTSHLIISPALRLGHTLSNSYVNAWYIKNRVMLIHQYTGGTTPQFLLEAGVVKSIH